MLHMQGQVSAQKDVIPAQAGIHGGASYGDRFPPALE
jgi:hypothetical protein